MGATLRLWPFFFHYSKVCQAVPFGTCLLGKTTRFHATDCSNNNQQLQALQNSKLQATYYKNGLAHFGSVTGNDDNEPTGFADITTLKLLAKSMLSPRRLVIYC